MNCDPLGSPALPLIDCDSGEFPTLVLRMVSYRRSQFLHHHPPPLGSHLRRTYFLSIQFCLHHSNIYISATTHLDANKPRSLSFTT